MIITCVYVIIPAMSDLRELAVFCHKMYNAIHAGFDVEKAFVVMQDDSDGRLNRAVKHTHAGIVRGMNLSEAMRQDEAVYTSELVDAVFVTEQTGHIEMAFERMGKRFDMQLETRRRIARAATYPVIVLIVFIIALFAVASVYKFTPLAIMISAALVGFVAAVVIMPLGTKELGKSSYLVGNVLIKLPVVGKMVMKSELADFASNMSVFYACGAEVSKGLEYSARSLRNEALRVKVLKAAQIVKRGVPLSNAMASTGIFPPDIVNAIQSGEQSGNVEGMLDTIERYYRAEVKGKSDIIFSVFRS